MPGMQGPALAHRLREERPSLRAALMTGYVGQEGDRRMEEPPADMLFIQKPFLAATFLRLIRSELDREQEDGHPD
jgi:FixJ family two-component response regulator